MAKELNIIIKSVAKNDIKCGIALALLLVIFKQYTYSIVFLLGVIISMMNFIVSAIMTNIFLNRNIRGKAFLFPVSYIFRIGIVIAIALFFSNKLAYLLTFLIGFIIHYITLVITTINVQKGSE